MTRIIAGKCKGLTLLNPSNQSIRPTTDRVKEWIFSVLQDVTGLDVLDLFCGAGNLGIEALSRGAKSCTFIDNSSDAIELTRKNLVRANLIETAAVKKLNVWHFLKNNKRKFHLVFADPPYKFTEMNQLLIQSESIILAGGRFFVESGESIKTEISPLEFIREKVFGTTVVTILGK